MGKGELMNKKFKKKRPKMLFVNDRENEPLQSLLIRILSYLERYVGMPSNDRNVKYSEEALEKKTKSIPDILVLSKKTYENIKKENPSIIVNNQILGMKLKIEN